MTREQLDQIRMMMAQGMSREAAIRMAMESPDAVQAMSPVEGEAMRMESMDSDPAAARSMGQSIQSLFPSEEDAQLGESMMSRDDVFRPSDYPGLMEKDYGQNELMEMLRQYQSRQAPATMEPVPMPEVERDQNAIQPVPMPQFRQDTNAIQPVPMPMYTPKYEKKA